MLVRGGGIISRVAGHPAHGLRLRLRLGFRLRLGLRGRWSMVRWLMIALTLVLDLAVRDISCPIKT